MPNHNANKAKQPSKKSIAALRANAVAMEQAFTNKNIVFARVDTCFGNSQFRLKMADGSEGRGTPLGKFTFATLRIAPGHIVICEAGKGVLTIIGRFDRRKDIKKLVENKSIPRSFLTGDEDGVCFEDGFEFEEVEENENAEDAEDNNKKINRILTQYKAKKQATVNPLQQANDILEAEADAIHAVNIDVEVDYDSRRFKRQKKIKSVVAKPSIEPVKKSLETINEEYNIDEYVFIQTKVPENWDDEIDIDAI
jgi:translation initiation factor IF-1